jgi:formylglycine-generating enzyme required for sulfatase activity
MRPLSHHFKSVLLGVVLFPFFTFAQENDFKNYTRELEGTELKFDMIAIPGGNFNMGSPATEVGRRPDEGPQHQVKISPFWIGKHEVTWDFF